MPLMTAVFDVPDDVWQRNPFHVETPFGKAITVANGDVCEKSAKLREALSNVISDVLTYERMNNLAPNPGRKYCWDSVAQAVTVLDKD